MNSQKVFFKDLLELKKLLYVDNNIYFYLFYITILSTYIESLSHIIERLATQLTGPVIRVTVDENAVILDALPIYKSTKFDAASPLTVRFQNQPAVDVGGPKREFYTRLFGDIAKADGGLNLVLFEGPDGRLMPKYSTTIVYSGILTVVGKMIAHSIVQCGIGFPFLSPAAYWYIVTGDIAMTVGYCNISDVRDIEVAQLIQQVIENSLYDYFNLTTT